MGSLCQFYHVPQHCLWLIINITNVFDTYGSVQRRLLSTNTNKMHLCNRIYYSKVFLKAQHFSSGIPLFIRSSKLYLQPLVYMPIWEPAVDVECPLSLGNGRSPYGHINQRLQI